MGTDTKLSPDRTTLRTERPVAAPAADHRVRTFLLVLALVAVLGVALVVAALVGGEPTTSDLPQPSVSPVQVEGWGVAGMDHEVQRFRNAVDVDRLTQAEQHEALRFSNAVDVER